MSYILNWCIIMTREVVVFNETDGSGEDDFVCGNEYEAQMDFPTVRSERVMASE